MHISMPAMFIHSYFYCKNCANTEFVKGRKTKSLSGPERFHPERRQGGLAKRLPRGVYFPFGSGPHICIGNHFALMEAILMLAVLAQQFRWTLANDRPVIPEPAVTLRPRNGMPLRFHRRKSEPTS